MSWRDQLQPASFRGVAFKIEGASASVGRRTSTHEYPLRDVPWVEDLGRRARQISLEAYVIGQDYMPARDALLAALESAGAGTLIHPYWGALTVAVTDCRVSESSREGGMARFSITFTEAGENRQPTARADAAAVLATRADTAQAAAQARFESTHSVDAMPGWVADSAVSEMNKALGAVDALIATLTPDINLLAEVQLDGSRIANTLADLVRVPNDVASALLGRITALAALPQNPLSAFAALKKLFQHSGSTPPTPTTPANQRAAGNVAATQALTRHSAVIEASRLLPQAEFENQSDALLARDAVLDALDLAVLETTDDSLYGALIGLGAAVTRAIAEREGKLARVGTVRLPSTMPALVVAYRIYGNTDRADSIVARNRLRHPGFVPGGVPLEVLL